jgi:two-component system invasion response regulator UvrY
MQRIDPSPRNQDPIISNQNQTMNKPIQVILVDDHKLIRESWKMLLQKNASIEVLLDCDTASLSIELTKSLSPDLILIDLNMTPQNGLNLAKKIREKLPNLKVIGLSVNNQVNYANKMMELGAMGYLTKTSSLEEIIRGIKEVHKGNTFICDEIKKNMRPPDTF